MLIVLFLRLTLYELSVKFSPLVFVGERENVALDKENGLVIHYNYTTSVRWI